jgi:murein L,D-transpeptidase YcbB/YkuD
MRPVACVIGLVLWLCAGLAMAAGTTLWFDGGRPGEQAQQAVALLADAPSHGLQPQDYAAAQLQLALARARQGSPLDAAQVARLEQGLTAAMQRYLADLHGGRVDPRKIHHDFDPPQREAFDAAAALRAALASGTLEQAVRDAAPQLPLYQKLRDALARYRGLARSGAWQHALPALPALSGSAGKLEPGQAYAGLPMLAERLALLGDLPPDAAVPMRYDAALVEAVRRFQSRHGLSPDGVIGKATFAQLAVAPAARARQIELMLERLRWTPLMQGPRMVVINVPEFVLRAYEVHGGRIHVRRQMKVIVGKAYDTRTPLFDEAMRYIEFSPYWNVPWSIARGETVPKLRRDPGFFDRQGFEFVGADGHVDGTLSPAHLDAVLAGTMRIRQRPGPTNALGDIKFIFPNQANIYLHHTPATSLFARERRDLSHGCIRLEDPVALATFVLQGMSGWTEARIRATMVSGKSSTLRLAEPVPVLIAYGTALVKDGRVHFFDDIYGLDRVLDVALRQRSPMRWTLE